MLASHNFNERTLALINTAESGPFQDKFLLVTDTRAHQLFQVDIATGEVRATIAVESFLPTAADYDDVSKNVFWFDSQRTNIRQTNLTSGTTKVFVDFIGKQLRRSLLGL